MKYFALPVYALLFSANAFVQVPAVEWSKCYGGSQDDIVQSVVQLATGDFGVGGSAQSNNGDVSGHHGSTSYYDYWIVNTNDAGILNWQKSYGGSEDDDLFAIEKTFDNGLVVAGYTFSDNGNVVGNNGNSDEWILKLNPSGTIAWKTCLGGSLIDYATDIKQTPDSGFVVVGLAYSADSDFTVSYGGGDYSLLKLDADGNFLWHKNFGGTGTDYCQSVEVTSDGGYLLSGYTNSTDHDVSFNHGYYDTWLVKTDAEGNIQWQKSYGGSNMEYNFDVLETTDGDFFVTGASLSNNGDVSGCHAPNTFHDVWVFLIDDTGELLWQKCYGGFNGDYGSSAIQSDDKGFIVAGYSASSDGDVTGHHGIAYNNDIWVFKINNFGDLLWQKSFGGTENDAAMDIIKTADGGFLIGGQTDSNDGDVSGNHGNKDCILIKFECNALTCYADADGDGFGNEDISLESCTVPAGYVLDNTDCNDLNNLIHPFATETCNNLDDDCDGFSDEGLVFTNYYADADIDGFGDAAVDSFSCNALAGYVINSTDCNDANNFIYPGATELCNGIDDDCNLLIDDAILFLYYYADADSDGYGDILEDSISCSIPEGYCLDNSDCNDAEAEINPAAVELCNDVDDDCNLLIDDGIVFTHYHPDTDEDGFGDPFFDVYACSLPTGYVTDFSDCNDADADIFPGADESCNLIDDNCNELIDEGLTFTMYYIDADGDDYGNAEIDSSWCDLVAGYVADNSDCDDSNAEIYPGAVEIENGLDDNCNAEIDEGLTEIQNDILNETTLYPNPAHDFLIVAYGVEGEIYMQVINLTGQIIISAKTNEQKTILDLKSIPAGIYILRSEMNGNISGLQFIVE